MYICIYLLTHVQIRPGCSTAPVLQWRIPSLKVAALAASFVLIGYILVLCLCRKPPKKQSLKSKVASKLTGLQSVLHVGGDSTKYKRPPRKKRNPRPAPYYPSGPPPGYQRKPRRTFRKGQKPSRSARNTEYSSSSSEEESSSSEEEESSSGSEGSNVAGNILGLMRDSKSTVKSLSENRSRLKSERSDKPRRKSKKKKKGKGWKG